MSAARVDDEGEGNGSYVRRAELNAHLRGLNDRIGRLEQTGSDILEALEAVRRSLEGRSWLGVRGRRVVDQLIPLIVAAIVGAAITALIASRMSSSPAPAQAPVRTVP